MSRLKERYQNEVAPALMTAFNYRNVMQVPRLHKIVVNAGVGEAIKNPKALDSVTKDIETITGQHPVTHKAKKSIAAFRLRAGMPVGVSVTLRGEHMYYFLDKLLSVALPRIRDFRGTPRKGLDGRGNYTLGLKEQLVFPEIEYDKVDKLRGLEVCIVTTANTDEEGMKLLELLGMPFSRQ
ncbi:MAG: 50S ribosomal protein L5 [Dehalococcoidia bacterium]|nr:50S ribosomal protein L5 [Dehalococcoidia bacterium]